MISERVTASRHSPPQRRPATQACHQRAVSAASALAAGWSGAGRCGRRQTTATGTRSPPATQNCACTAPPSVATGTGLNSQSVCAPPVIWVAPPCRRTRGVVSPYSNRGASVIRMSTRPVTPSTSRISTGSVPRTGMQSASRTVPEAVLNSVSSTRVPGRYRRRTWLMRVAGAICQWPLRSSPSSAAKQASESNRGRHSQSMEPSRLISAAVCRSPTSAYSSIGAGMRRPPVSTGEGCSGQAGWPGADRRHPPRVTRGPPGRVSVGAKRTPALPGICPQGR